MQRRKIVIIGAGSAMFTQGLVADLILSGDPWKLGLADIDPRALETAEGLSRRMIAAREADIELEASTDRRDLLPGADVVVVTIGVGGRRAWEADVVIPRKYGIYQPVGDSVMAGGISRAMRMVPANVEIAKDVLALCPQAFFVNYSNPMTVICWAIRKATGANVVGLCIGTHHVYQELAALIGAPETEVSYLAAGVNHFTWIYDLRWRGQDAWPQVRAALARESKILVRGQDDAGDDAPAPEAPGGDTTLRGRHRRLRAADNPFSWSLFETYGAYPAVNDRHVVEFFPERFPNGDYYGRRLGVDVFSVEKILAHGDEIYAHMRAQALGEIPLDQGVFERAAGEHAQLVEIIHSMAGDDRRMYAANLPNGGAITGLPPDAVLEMSVAAAGRGLLPVQVPDFPAILAAPLLRKIAAHEITVEAALTGSRKLFVEALLADGSLSEPTTAERLADELLLAQQRYLPQFA
jgi:alpha-galactosidase